MIKFEIKKERKNMLEGFCNDFIFLEKRKTKSFPLIPIGLLIDIFRENH